MDAESKGKCWWENLEYTTPKAENYQYTWDKAAYMGDWIGEKEAAMISRGDIIQITDEGHTWFGCLMIVSEVKEYGVIAYMDVPRHSDKADDRNGSFNIFYRSTYEKVGKAILFR
jgi:hypothetical protein